MRDIVPPGQRPGQVWIDGQTKIVPIRVVKGYDKGCFKGRDKGFFPKFSIIFRLILVLIVSVSLVFLPVFRPIPQAQAGTFTFLQTDWNGGLDGGTRPNHTSNRTGWTKYDTSDMGVSTSTVGEISLTYATASSTNQTTNGHFDAGTHSSTATSSNSVKLAQTGPAFWSTQVLDPTVDTDATSIYATGTSIYIAYRDNANNDLEWASSTDSGTTWATSTIESTAAVGTFTSIQAINANTIYIAYQEVLNSDARFATSTNGGATWAIIPVSSNAPEGSYTSLYAKDADNILIEHVSVNGSDNPHEQEKSTNAGSSWTNSVLFSGSGNTTGSWGNRQMEIDGVGNNVFIAYRIDWSANNLAFRSSTDFGANWSGATAIDSTNDVGLYPYIDAVDANTLYISYHQETDGDLKLATSTNGGSTWATKVVDNTATDVGEDTSIHAFDANNIYIAYRDVTNGDLKVASSSNAGSTWTLGTIDSNSAGTFTGIYSIDANHVYVSYVGANSDLKFAKYVPGYASSGTFTSKILDTTVGGARWATTSWNATTPTNTTIDSVKIRTSNNSDMSGATAFASCNAITSGADISSNNCVTDDHRYIQYEVKMSTTDSASTPSFDDITINYNIPTTSDTLTFSAYDTGDSANAVSSLKWTETLGSGADVRFQMRTAPDSSGSPGTFSSYCGPDNGAAGCDTTTYFTAPAGSETVDADFTDGSNDQWVQVQVTATRPDGSVNATLSDFTLTYVVNAAPAIASVTSSQGSNGVVTATYNLSDDDNSTATTSLAYDIGVTLSSSLTSATTTILVSSGTNFPSSGSLFIDNEEVSYTATSSVNNLTGVSRGRNNSSAVSHSSAARVYIKAATVSGSAGAAVTTGTGKSISWTAATDLPNFSASDVEVKIIANDNQGANQVGAATSSAFSIDTVVPTMLTSNNVRSAVLGVSSIEITWTTNESSDSVVNYGLTTSYGATSSSDTLVTSHSATLTGLSASTLYFYRVKSTDAKGNILTDDNSGSGYRATTTAAAAAGGSNVSYISSADTILPDISNIKTANITENSATITWETNENASSLVHYGLTSNYQFLAGRPDVYVTSHSVSLSKLEAGKTYHYKVSSFDAAGNQASSEDKTFATLAKAVAVVEIPTVELAALEEEVALQAVQIQSFEERIAALTSEINAKNNALSSLIEQLNQLRPTLSPEEIARREEEIKRLQKEIREAQDKVTVLEAEPRLTSEGAKVLSGVKKAFEEAAPTLPDIKQVITAQVSSFSEELVAGVFQTAVRIVSVPLAIVGEEPKIEVGQERATFSWFTDRRSSSVVALASAAEYDSKSAEPYPLIVGDPDEEVTSHVVKITGLKPNSLYHYQLRSRTALGGETRTEDKTFRTPSLAPLIENIAVEEMKEHEAVLRFSTNVPTDTTIRLTNLTTGEVKTQGEEILRTLHRFKIADLDAATNYTAQILVKDEFGQEAVSSRLPLLTSSDTNPPQIAGLRTESTFVRAGRVQTIVIWETDEPSTSQVFWQEGLGVVAVAGRSLLNTDLVKRHIIVLSQLKPATLYQLEVESSDAAGNTSRSPQITIFTPRQQESVLQLIIKTFEQTFKFGR